MAQLAIKTHPKFGEKIIQLLEMLDGNNHSRYSGYNTNTNTIYYIDSRDRNFIKMKKTPVIFLILLYSLLKNFLKNTRI